MYSRRYSIASIMRYGVIRGMTETKINDTAILLATVTDNQLICIKTDDCNVVYSANFQQL